jgi:hypothetical protein
MTHSLSWELIAGFSLDRRNVYHGLQQPPVVELVDLFERGELDLLQGEPRLQITSALWRPLIVTASAYSYVADAVDLRLDAGVGEALRVFDQDIFGGFNGLS